jgi:hypothetical protein
MNFGFSMLFFSGETASQEQLAMVKGGKSKRCLAKVKPDHF